MQFSQNITDNKATIMLEGEIDLEKTEELREQAMQCLDSNQELEFGMSKVEYIDSSTVSVMIELHQKAEEDSKLFTINNPSEQVSSVLKMAKLLIFSKSHKQPMSFSFNIKTKYTLIFSGIACMLLSLFLTYKGILAYLIEKKLEDDFGGMGGTDTIVIIRLVLSLIILILALFFFHFLKIKDLNSQKILLQCTLVMWSVVSICLVVIMKELSLYLILSLVSCIISFLSIKNLKEEIKNNKLKLSDKEIYLLNKLANKK